ncbi:Uncharacterised protein [Bordetella pertussis]|nr:Uncharacterised protein [Bordetella pertussis]
MITLTCGMPGLNWGFSPHAANNTESVATRPKAETR